MFTVIRVKTWIDICIFYLAKDYGQKFVPALKKKDLCSSVRQRSYFPFLNSSSKQGKKNVKTGHFEVIERENKKDVGYKKLNFRRANNFSLTKNHAILYKYDSIQASSVCRFCQLYQTVLKLLFESLGIFLYLERNQKY